MAVATQGRPCQTPFLNEWWLYLYTKAETSTGGFADGVTQSLITPARSLHPAHRFSHDIVGTLLRWHLVVRREHITADQVRP